MPSRIAFARFAALLPRSEELSVLLPNPQECELAYEATRRWTPRKRNRDGRYPDRGLPYDERCREEPEQPPQPAAAVGATEALVLLGHFVENI